MGKSYSETTAKAAVVIPLNRVKVSTKKGAVMAEYIVLTSRNPLKSGQGFNFSLKARS